MFPYPLCKSAYISCQGNRNCPFRHSFHHQQIGSLNTAFLFFGCFSPFPVISIETACHGLISMPVFTSNKKLSMVYFICEKFMNIQKFNIFTIPCFYTIRKWFLYKNSSKTICCCKSNILTIM